VEGEGKVCGEKGKGGEEGGKRHAMVTIKNTFLPGSPDARFTPTVTRGGEEGGAKKGKRRGRRPQVSAQFSSYQALRLGEEKKRGGKGRRSGLEFFVCVTNFRASLHGRKVMERKGGSCRLRFRESLSPLTLCCNGWRNRSTRIKVSYSPLGVRGRVGLEKKKKATAGAPRISNHEYE